jgi:hypothetical protein
VKPTEEEVVKVQQEKEVMEKMYKVFILILRHKKARSRPRGVTRGSWPTTHHKERRNNGSNNGHSSDPRSALASRE